MDFKFNTLFLYKILHFGAKFKKKKSYYGALLGKSFRDKVILVLYDQNVLITVYLFFEVIKSRIGYIRRRENPHLYKAQIKFLYSLDVEKLCLLY